MRPLLHLSDDCSRSDLRLPRIEQEMRYVIAPPPARHREENIHGGIPVPPSQRPRQIHAPHVGDQVSR